MNNINIRFIFKRWAEGKHTYYKIEILNVKCTFSDIYTNLYINFG